MAALKVEFEITRDDFEKTVLAVLERDPLTRRSTRRVRFILGGYAVALALGLLALELLAGDVPIWFAVLTAAVIGWIAAFWPGNRRYRRIARRHVEMVSHTPAGRAVLGRRTARVTADGLAIETRFGTYNTRWAGVFDVIPTADHLFLVLPGPSYVPIPRQAFEYDEDFHQFCDAVADMADRVRAGGPPSPGAEPD